MSEISLIVSKNVRNNIIVESIGFKESSERFLFEGSDRKILYHPWLSVRLKLKTNQFVYKKTIYLPLDNNLISKYYDSSTKQFIFNDKILKSNNEISVLPPCPSEIKNKFNRLKFDHQKDDVNVFLSNFKDLVNLGLDETAAKQELLRFFKRSDQSNLFHRLNEFSLESLYVEFFSLYREENQYWFNYYKNLSLESSLSLERYLEEKIKYYKEYEGLSLAAVKNSLLIILPESISNRLLLYQPTIRNYQDVIEYICLRAEELNYSKIIRKRDERQLDVSNDSINNLNNISLSSQCSDIVKLKYPKRS